MIKSVKVICLFLGKIYIDLTKTFTNLMTFYFINSIIFQCRISSYDEILLTPRIYKIIGCFFKTWEISHALNGTSDSTPIMLTLNSGQ